MDTFWFLIDKVNERKGDEYNGAELAVCVHAKHGLHAVEKFLHWCSHQSISLIGVDAVGCVDDLTDNYPVLVELDSRMAHTDQDGDIVHETLAEYSDVVFVPHERKYLFSVEISGTNPGMIGAFSLIVVSASTVIDAMHRLHEALVEGGYGLRSIDDTGWVEQFDDEDFAFGSKVSDLSQEISGNKKFAMSELFEYAAEEEPVLN